MLPKLTFLTALVLMAAFLAASHCGEAYPDCGHVEGASCPDGDCIALPGFGGAPDSYCARDGGGGGATATPVATATPTTAFWKSIAGQYSYEAAAIYCDGRDPVAYQIDPITVISRFHYHDFLQFVQLYPTNGQWGGSPEEIWEHADNHVRHHGWHVERGRGQFCREGGGCSERGKSRLPFLRSTIR